MGSLLLWSLIGISLAAIQFSASVYWIKLDSRTSLIYAIELIVIALIGYVTFGQESTFKILAALTIGTILFIAYRLFADYAVRRESIVRANGQPERTFTCGQPADSCRVDRRI